MDNRLDRDLLAAHADDPDQFRQRQESLFAAEVERLEPLLSLAEQLFDLFEPRPVMRESFRHELRAELIAQSYQRGPSGERWRWAALGTSAAVAAAAVVAWRYTQRSRPVAD